ncbi:MAG: 2-enoyl thioester reductase domain-containing protein [Chthoniobacter sp.]|nr:2-enoyl thioester reductase domain-containing protein [Chthoniobacter sp.]
MNVSAIVIQEFGVPTDVVRVATVEVPALTPKGARVRVLASPINPADLNVLEGKYPIRPKLPGVPGVEGVGVVEEIGAEVKELRVGDHVLLPHGLGSWREAAMIADADETLTVVPPEVPVEQAAMLRINPATALRMLRDFAELAPGDFVIQNAANSAVGQLVIQIAKANGWRTINLVRRPELIDELRALGGDVVLLDSDEAKEQIAAAADGAPVRLALNCVGGDSALRVANALAPGGTHVTFGAMSRQPLRIPNGLLIFKDLRWRGFWITQWYREASHAAEAVMFAELSALAKRGLLHTPVERVYPFGEAVAAVKHAAQSQRAGKILFGAPEIVAQFSPQS